MAPLTESEHMKVGKLLEELGKNELYCDPDFPATIESLYLDPDKDPPEISWKRPHELCAAPQIFVDGTSKGDVKQGNLGDCWFLSVITSVAMRPDLIQQVIPEGQVLYGVGYKGLVCFRFWRMGEWITVYIDDRLPVDQKNELIYAGCKDANEFWLALVEKAFGKFHGGYKRIDGGWQVEAFTGLTGFITECLYTAGWDRKKLFQLLRLESKNGSLINCSRGEEDVKKGLPESHAYTVTGTRRLRSETEGLVRLVRIRNPWGHEEWLGAWGDKDSRWNQLDISIKKELDYSACNDGEYWMKMAHFMKYFEDITLATKIPDFNSEYVEKVDHLYTVRSAWKENVNAGGSKDDIELYATNPQYLITVYEPDDGEVCEVGEASDDELTCKEITTCNVVVELIQENNREKYEDLNVISLDLYQTFTPNKRISPGLLKELEPLRGSNELSIFSSVVGRFDLEPGSYVAIPCTYQPNQNRDFMLRIYCRKRITCQEMK